MRPLFGRIHEKVSAITRCRLFNMFTIDRLDFVISSEKKVQ